MISIPDTSDRSSEVTIVLGHGQVLHKHSLPIPRRVILSPLAGRPRIFPYPRTEYWAWPFSYAGRYENGYWAWSAPMQFGHRVSISPHSFKNNFHPLKKYKNDKTIFGKNNFGEI